ncbi:MAG: DUF1592 domain-containing protein, partial [Myxococcales bacterium]|nr:DUF1592 domain-containing protein [Myxococcales bacterium]
MVTRWVGVGLAAAALSCGAGCDDGGGGGASGADAASSAPWADVVHPPAFDVDAAEKLSPRALLARLSLDLRGVRPTEAEVARVDADPGAIAAITDEMLASARFPDRVRDLYAQVLRTRVEDFPVSAELLGFEPEEQAAVFASIGEEPLQVIARVAAEDRPYTDLVTADWTMADERLALAWPVTYPAGATGWQVARYEDGRPMAGLLSENGVWWRYLSDGVNYGRGRANAVARIFLCADFLDRPVDFPRDIDLTDEAGIREAVRENTGCIGCHAGLDPLASYLAGFQYTEKTAAEMIVYHPEREPQWRGMTELAPGFYGAPGYSLRDLGRQVAADPRFVTCAVETAWELLLRRPPDFRDAGEVDALTRAREAFLAGGLTIRALFR